ncbi:hypothetical protein CFOL_v3_14368, partial [Cephalotus follicularis]
YQFLMGLNPEFDIVRQNILQKDHLSTLQQAYAFVHKEENQQHLYSMTPTSDHSAFTTSGSFQPYTPLSTNKSHVRCDYCGKPYHMREQCWKLHGKPPGIGKGKGVNKGRSQAHEAEVIGPIGFESVNSTGIGNFLTKEEMQQLIKDMINLKGPNSSHVASSASAMSSTSYPFSGISSYSSSWT